jgi:hypothetical protein
MWLSLILYLINPDWWSLNYSRTKNNRREVDIIWITFHELSDLLRSASQKLFLTTNSVINRAFFETVKLINPSIFWHKGNKMRVTLSLNTWNSFIYGLLVLGQYLLAVFENLSSLLKVFPLRFDSKFVQKGFLSN